VQAQPVRRASRYKAEIAHQKIHWNQARANPRVSIEANNDAGCEQFKLSEKCEAGFERGSNLKSGGRFCSTDSHLRRGIQSSN
jgi:hypothetical protein